MSTSKKRIVCPDCGPDWSRRDFLTVAGAAALAAGAAPLLAARSWAAPTPQSAAETAVARFYGTLSDEQKKEICFSFDHELRQRVNANWAITKPSIHDDFYSDEQRKIIDEILRSATSEDGYGRIMKQVDDDSGGIGDYHIAVFGQPGSGKFEWELTGRHLTLRCDGDSVENVAFGGPIVYGHGEEGRKHNVFHYQTEQAHEVFKALDGKQREQALLAKAPSESQVPLQGAQGKFPGISVGELSSDQQKLVEEVVKVILAPYRKEDIDEAMAVLKAGGGVEKLHMAFYKEGDVNKDEVWDIWRVEGPSFVCHFRGAPHVHAYINIGTKS
jgi:hypothetical protein